jgi:hypothetical protein
MDKISNGLLIASITLITLGFSQPVIADTEDANEVGVEWTNAYDFYYNDPDEGLIYLQDVHYCDDFANGFYNKLGANGFSKEFNWGNTLAWEEDFKKAEFGGTDSSWVDDVDFVVYSGHGSPTGFYFNNDHDDRKLRGTKNWHDAEWRNRDLEWIVLNACEVLTEYDDHGNWAERWARGGVFKGLHLLLGWDSKATDNPDRGRIFAEYMVDANFLIKDAWFKACDETSPSGRVAVVIGVIDEGYNALGEDHLWGHGTVVPDRSDPIFIEWLPHTVP